MHHERNAKDFHTINYPVGLPHGHGLMAMGMILWSLRTLQCVVQTFKFGLVLGSIDAPHASQSDSEQSRMASIGYKLKCAIFYQLYIFLLLTVRCTEDLPTTIAGSGRHANAKRIWHRCSCIWHRTLIKYNTDDFQVLFRL
jgi:hypothetical protein